MKGFTLIELMVAITISMLLMGGLALSLSKYYNLEKINKTASEINSSLSLARTLAVTGQVPTGFTDELSYVEVVLRNNGPLEALAHSVFGVGESYFSKRIIEGRTSVSINADLFFAKGTGKLVDSNGTPLSTNAEVGITISSPDVDDIRQITITSLGTIK